MLVRTSGHKHDYNLIQRSSSQKRNGNKLESNYLLLAVSFIASKIYVKFQIDCGGRQIIDCVGREIIDYGGREILDCGGREIIYYSKPQISQFPIYIHVFSLLQCKDSIT